MFGLVGTHGYIAPGVARRAWDIKATCMTNGSHRCIRLEDNLIRLATIFNVNTTFTLTFKVIMTLAILGDLKCEARATGNSESARDWVRDVEAGLDAFDLEIGVELTGGRLNSRGDIAIDGPIDRGTAYQCDECDEESNKILEHYW